MCQICSRSVQGVYDRYLKDIVRLFSWCVGGTISERIDEIRGDFRTQEEVRSSGPPWGRPATRLRTGPNSGGAGRPRDFAEPGLTMKAGCSWEKALSGWLHDFVRLQDPAVLKGSPRVGCTEKIGYSWLAWRSSLRGAFRCRGRSGWTNRYWPLGYMLVFNGLPPPKNAPPEPISIL